MLSIYRVDNDFETAQVFCNRFVLILLVDQESECRSRDAVLPAPNDYEEVFISPLTIKVLIGERAVTRPTGRREYIHGSYQLLLNVAPAHPCEA